jgi:hypothetical protein
VKSNPLLPQERLWHPKPYPLLEWVTAIVLVLVLASLVWMAMADLLPQPWRLLSLEAEIIGILALLITTILLVSVLALLQTQDRTNQVVSGTR